MTHAVIEAAQLTAGHDGAAELVLQLRYPNGGVHSVTLDQEAGKRLMQNCQARHVDDLLGQDWQAVRDALTSAWNRFNTQTGT